MGETRLSHPLSEGLDFLWFLPTNGDVRFFGSEEGLRPATNGYLREIAQACERLGYSGVLLPTGLSCEDAWIIASSIVSHTETLKFLVAIRPGSIVPAESARQASAFDRLSKGRLLLNVVAGGDPAEQAGDGNFLNHDDRYRQTAEFLSIWRKLIAGEIVDYEGEYLRCKGGKLAFPPVQRPYPPLYFGGSSPVAREVAAEHVDFYLTWGEPPAQVAEKIADMRARASALGRHLRFGIRLHFIVRETDEKAWAAADELIRRVPDEVIEAAQRKLRGADSEGQRRMNALHDGNRDKLEISPNLWAGIGLIRPGAATALVGSAETVAARLKEYLDLGIDTVIGSGYPHLEEAYRVSEMLFPLLSDRMNRVREAPLRFASNLAGAGTVVLSETDTSFIRGHAKSVRRS